MKVQLQGQRLRLRIDEAELARLLAGEPVENLTRLPGGQACRQRLRVSDAAAPALVDEGDGWCCLLPRTQLAPYVARLPCRDGLAFRLPLGDGGDDALEVDVEVDVRDSVRSRGTLRR